MSTVKSKKLQVGTDATSSNNFTIYQPATPDGTLRIGVGNADSPTEVGQFNANGYKPTTAPAFGALISSSQTVTTSTYTKLQFDTEEFDLTSDFDTSTYKFTPSVAGYYQFNYEIFVNHIGSGQYLYALLYKNGAAVKQVRQIDDNVRNKSLQGSTLVYANGTTDYFELYGYHSFGSDTTFYSTASVTQFQAHLVQQA
jgi:hypothetical protein